MITRNFPSFEPDDLREDRLKQERYIQLLLNSANETGERIFAYKTEQSETAIMLGDFERNHPKLTRAGIGQATSYTLIALAMPAIYLIDFILLYRTAEFIAGLAFGRGSWMRGVACAVIPLVILLLEKFVADRLASFYEDEEEDDTHLWRILAWLMILVMPFLVMATALAYQTVRPLPSVVFIVQLIGLTALAVVCHAAILLGGKASKKAHSYLWFQLIRSRMKRRIRWLTLKIAAELKKFDRLFGKYTHKLTAFNRDFPNFTLKIGPFNVHTIELIEERFSRQEFRDRILGA